MAAYESLNYEESEDSDLEEYQENVHGLQPYQFEPRRPDGESDADDSSENELSSEDDVGQAERLGNIEWCQCKKYSHLWLIRTREHVCCKELDKARALAAPSNTDATICITNNADFQLLCLTPVVLRNVLVALNNVRADHWNVNPPNNKSLRYAAYRQFTWWVHGKLGPCRRRVIPACATHAIRGEFPKADDEEYEGYHSASEDSDNE